MEGEAQHSDQRFWFARDGGVSWGAGLSVLKPGRSQANRDSWSPSQWPASDSPGEKRIPNQEFYRRHPGTGI